MNKDAPDPTEQNQNKVKQALAHIYEHIGFYADRLSNHPIRKYLQDGSVPRSIMQEFAATQYRECLMWVPMLSLMKDHARHKTFKRALRANMLCEAGASDTSHVELCHRFVESMGVKLNSENFNTMGASLAINFQEFGYITSISEAETAGWILAAEELTPVSFALFLEGFKQIPGVAMEYLTEHVTVDGEQHAVWMREAVVEMLTEDPGCFEEIMTGIHGGAQAITRIPDTLYTKTLTQRQVQTAQPARRAVAAAA